jgi:hypothetical protein
MTISSCEKALVKPAQIGVPPGAVEGIGHHFEDDDIVMDDLALGFAGSLSLLAPTVGKLCSRRCVDGRYRRGGITTSPAECR